MSSAATESLRAASAMQIFVTTFLGTIDPIAFDVRPNELVDDVKIRIALATGVPVDLQRLIIDGVKLESCSMVSD